jgi:putative membrane protein
MTPNSCLKALPAALLCLGFAAGALAQNTAAPSGSASPGAAQSSSARDIPAATGRAKRQGVSNISHSDRKFVEDAAKGGMAEVDLGQFAQTHAQNEQVKQFAARMVRDHGKANEQLRQLAQAKGVTMPEGPKHKDNHEMSKLSKLTGADFDREYMDAMVKDHRKDVKEFQKQADKAKDPDVKSFASGTLPTLQEHLKLAEEADAAVGGKMAASSKTKTSMR